MTTLKITGFCLFMLSAFFSCRNDSGSNSSKSLELQLDSLRTKYNIPAIAYGVIRNDSVLIENAIGYRNIETREKVSLGDLFHIGSNTKAFTAFLAAKLIENGLISWNTKFYDLYPEMKPQSNPAYAEITLQQLLSHRARLI